MKKIKDMLGWSDRQIKLFGTITKSSVLLTVLLAPNPAYAFWGWVVSWVAAAFVAAPIITAIVVTAVIITAVNYVSAKVKAASGAGMGDMPDFAVTGAKGIMVNKTGSSEAIPVIYGATRTGAIRVLTETQGTVGSGDDEIKNAYLHAIYVLGEGEMNKCSAIYFDGIEAATCSTAGSTDPGSWTVNSPWSGDGGKVQVYFRPGTDGQTDISQVDGLKTWTGSPDFKGVAYVYLRLEYEAEIWTNGLPQVTFQVEGKKVPQTNDGTTLSYDDNPARCILDYLVNSRYGKAIPVADLDLTTFATAETYCTNNSYHCRGNLGTQATLYANLFDLLATCRGFLTLGNKYRLLLDSPNTMTPIAINDDNTIGNIDYILATKETMFNKITAKYLNESTEYKDDIKVVESSALQTQDNGLVLDMEVAYPFVKTESVVNRLMAEEINQSRQSHSISLTTTIGGIDLEVGDIVKVTNSTFGITDKLFRVLVTEVHPDSEVKLTLREYDADVYSATIRTDARNDDND